MRWLLLSAAIGFEVAATLMLRQSEGFSKLAPSLLTALGYALAFFSLGHVLKTGMPIVVAYAVWSAVGLAVLAILGRVLFGEELSTLAVIALVLIVVGVVLLHAATAGSH